MGNNDYRRQVEELVRRCEAVGWQVVKTGKNYYKVDTRRGTFTVPSTPSSQHSVSNTVALAMKHGLEELEEKVKLQREARRQERINADRRANDALYDRIANGNGDVASTHVASTITAAAAEPVFLGRIADGTPILAVGPALVQTPVMSKPAPLRFGEELLLADERVVYRCTYVDDATLEACHRTFDSAQGLQIHNAWHVRPINQRPNHHKRWRHTRTQEGEKEIVTTTATPTPTTPAERELVLTRIEELSGAIFDVGAKLIDVRNNLIGLADAVKKLPDGAPDPELVAKAAKFDALRATLGGLIQ